MTARESRLAESFVSLADTLVKEFDVAELLYRLVDISAEIFAADQAGLVIADAGGQLHVVAATSEATHLIEVLQIQNGEGPCLDAYELGQQVVISDIADAQAQDRWPTLSSAIQELGFRAVTALPLRLRTETLGSMNLFRVSPGEMPSEDLASAQALADVATIGILQERAVRDARMVIDQLQTALNSRIAIEQAKGFVAQQVGISINEAFNRIRKYARDHNLGLTETARRIVNRTLDPSEFAPRG
ncbi:MAG: ANTAR domain-containing protein [Acidimicrobiia bacterium]